MIKFDLSKCVRCGECVRDCVAGIIHQDADDVPSVSPENFKFCLNCQHCLAVCQTGAVECNGVTAEECSISHDFPRPEQMLDLISFRRSIRRFREENVDRETLDKLEKVLKWTPTGCNDHRLFFAVSADRASTDYFRNETVDLCRKLVKCRIPGWLFPRYRRFFHAVLTGEDLVFRGAPHFIVAATPGNAPCRAADPWIALSYFDLHAQSLGVGTCWCGFAERVFRLSGKMRRKLGIPAGYRIGAVMLFGFPEVHYPRATNPVPMLLKEISSGEQFQ